MSLSKLFGNPSTPGYKRIQYYIIGLSFGLLLIFSVFYIRFAVEIFLGMAPPFLIGLWTVDRVTKIYLDDPPKVTNFMVIAFGLKMVVYAAYFILLFVFSTFNRWHFIISFLGFFSVLHALEAMYFSYLLKQPHIR